MARRSPRQRDAADTGDGALRQLRVWLALTDLGVIVWATLGAQLLRFGLSGGRDIASTTERFALDYSTFSLGLALVWWLALRAHGLYEPHVLGHGATEYRLLGAATLRVFAGLVRSFIYI